MKRRSPIHAYKRLLARDQDWDYAFLIALEKKKLQRMHDYFKHKGHLENNAIVVRDIAICIRLIDIFMQDDAAYSTWLHKSYSGELKWRKLEDGMYELDDSDSKPLADFPVYVNVRNERRFFYSTPIRDAQTEGHRDHAIHLITSLRQQKALHLYHLIREYRLMTWWD
ncbi:MAG: hypothetical protein IJT19_09100 [Bacteroidaceae bacterium]|nr:hypothetical protein [Bacteroidaceae bacterium]